MSLCVPATKVILNVFGTLTCHTCLCRLRTLTLDHHSRTHTCFIVSSLLLFSTRGPTGANPCCSDQCRFLDAMSVCQENVDCINQVNCTGKSAMCNVTSADYKPDRTTLCNSGSNTCLNGDCTGSVCTVLAVSNSDVSECQCTGNDQELCDVCCTDTEGECISSFKLQVC